MKIRKINIVLIISILLLAVFVLIFPEFAIARPGGGHSYSGGGGGGGVGGGGGGDGIGMLIFLLFKLLPPYISIPLVIIIFIVYKIYTKRESSNTQISSVSTFAIKDQNSAAVSRQIHSIKAADPNFSRVLFIDFVTSLYVKSLAYKYQPKKLKTISPFIDKSILEKSQEKSLKTEVNEIVVGGINISNITQDANFTQLVVEINANYTQTINNKSTRYIVTEKWLLERKAGTLSSTPDKMQQLSCPSCGAPANFNDAGECAHCGNMIAQGEHQWFVKNSTLVYTDTIKTNSLTSYSAEVGTNYPTVFSTTVQSEASQFAASHNTTWEKYWSIFYHSIASKYFMEIYKYWSLLDWNKVRHLLTDRLWESYNFWIGEYLRYGLRNILEDTKILKMHLVKIETDKFYEAITVRIFASNKDYVIDKSGKVVGGYSKSDRIFSEYWTFVRRSGVENDTYDMKSCPSCGAPLDKMGQNGVCDYCGSKVTTGQFTWVLASIVQDEEYKG